MYWRTTKCPVFHINSKLNRRGETLLFNSVCSDYQTLYEPPLKILSCMLNSNANMPSLVDAKIVHPQKALFELPFLQGCIGSQHSTNNTSIIETYLRPLTQKGQNTGNMRTMKLTYMSIGYTFLSSIHYLHSELFYIFVHLTF